MARPTLCMIHEVIRRDNAIGKVAMAGVQIALEAGYRVTVVAKVLDPTLHGDVEWLPLYVPPRLFFVQWVTARRFIRRALGLSQEDFAARYHIPLRVRLKRNAHKIRVLMDADAEVCCSDASKASEAPSVRSVRLVGG